MSATEHVHEVVVIGGLCTGAKLREAGITNFVSLEKADELASSVFDEVTHTWTLNTRGGESYRTRIVIASDTIAVRRDGLAPYLGVAVHGVPNHFLLTGPDVNGQVGYVLECLRLMARTGSTRMEVRHSTQRVFNDRTSAKPRGSSYWRRMGKRIRSAFDLSSGIGVEDEVYDGPATVTIGGDDHAVRVRLTGHIDPIDGRYHWQGTVFEALPDDELKSPVTITIGERTVAARISERTPQGSYSVVGVGAPPFALDDVELSVPVV